MKINRLTNIKKNNSLTKNKENYVKKVFTITCPAVWRRNAQS